MIFNNKAPDWGNGGTEPPENLKKEGFTAGYKPPAAYFNWFFNRIQKAVKELQEKLATDLKGLAFKDTVSDADIDDVSAEKIEQDEAHRFVTDAEKNSWDKKASTLDEDMTVYVATTGSDTTGDGTAIAPYKTITYAISKIPNDLGGHTAIISIADGTYDEDIVVRGIANGYFRIQRNGTQELNSLCNIKSIVVENCDSVSISGFNITTVDNDSVFINRTDFVNVAYCQSISNAPISSSFRFDYILLVRISGCRSLNHDSCLRSYFSRIYSENWSGDSVGITYGTYLDGGSQLHNGGTFQPRGNVSNKNATNGGFFVSTYGVTIGTLTKNTILYVSTAGSDITGNGAQANPFKTIQYAINAFPKDLGGNKATIKVADGTYNETIYIQAFSGGSIALESSNTTAITNVCNIRNIVIGDCTAKIYVSGFNITNTADQGITAYNSSVRIDYCSITGVSSLTAIYLERTFAEVYSCLVSNRNVALHANKSHVTSGSWTAGTNNNYGISSTYGSVVNTFGIQPQGTVPLHQNTGGTYLNSNGTQISDLITSGLSCTWGTLTGGYRRVGNLNGVSQIIVSVTVVLTANLTADTYYTVSGLPAQSDAVNIACSVDDHYRTKSCYITASGILTFRTAIALTPGLTMNFSAIYITNS